MTVLALSRLYWRIVTLALSFCLSRLTPSVRYASPRVTPVVPWVTSRHPVSPRVILVSRRVAPCHVGRFAQFFIAPLLRAESTEREVLAVENEHVKNLQSDGWRGMQARRLSLPLTVTVTAGAACRPDASLSPSLSQ